jgi:hypothetical protein
MWRLLLCCSLFFSSLQALSFKEKICQGKPGDFIVTEQGKSYTLLLIRAVDAFSLVLEEISTPLRPPSWKEWRQQGAHGHTSWILYTIDLRKNSLKECYSVSTHSLIPLDDSEEFLTRLLGLPLLRVALEERRRIGPPPLPGETDRRTLWTPPIHFKGEKKTKPVFDVFKAKWPNDGTLLSSCTIELYFDARNPNFPFPYWIEIKSPHYALPIRTIESGDGML